MPSKKQTGKQLIRRRMLDKKLFLAALLLEGIILVFSLSILYTIHKYEILPIKYRIPLTLIFIIANIYFAIILKSGINNRGIRKAGLAIAALVLAFCIGFSFYMGKTVAALNKVSEVAEKPVEVKELVMTVRVMKNSPITSMADLEGKKISAPYSTDKNKLDNFYASYIKDNKATFVVSDVPSYLTAVEELYDSLTQAIIFNEDYLSIILSKFPDFKEETRVLSSGTMRSEEVVKIKKVDTAKESFTVLISGVDTFDSIETSSRSDVNMLVTINPKAKHILITTIPRDTYMKIPGEGMNEWDKLTHAGIYGVTTSVEAVESFLDIAVNYYVKVNFTSVISLVDLIGGVQIDNPYEFNTVDWKTFPAGPQALNGADTLSYVRERYNLLDGDNDRGKNQERVLSAIIRKLMGKEILTNFSSLIEIAKSSMQTSLSANDLMKLANMQLESGSTWKIEMDAITGEGQYGWSSYAAPGYDVFVQIPDEASVAEAKKRINAVLRGVEYTTAQTSESE